METLYMISHEIEFDENREIIKYLGVFDSKDKAEKAFSKLRKMPDFMEGHGELFLGWVEVNYRYWEEGYFTE